MDIVRPMGDAGSDDELVMEGYLPRDSSYREQMYALATIYAIF